MRLIFKALILFTSCALGLPASADSLSADISRHVDAEYANLQKSYVGIEVPDEAKGEHYSETVVTMIGMAVVAGVAAYRESEKIARIRGEPISKQEKEDLIKGITNAVIGPDTAATLVAGKYAAKGAAPYINNLTGPMAAELAKLSPQAATAMKAIVSNSISNAVFQVGMVGTDKFVDATLNSMTDEEQTKARSWIANLAKGQYKIVTGHGDEGIKLEDQGYEGIGLFLKHSSAVAIGDFDGAWSGGSTSEKLINVGSRVANNDRRDLWLYDTWRQGIMTGKFETNTAAMTAGALAGTYASSGGGPVAQGIGASVGAMGGLALNSQMTPDWVNQKLDEKNQTFRKNTIRTGSLKWCTDRITLGLRAADNHQKILPARPDEPHDLGNELLDNCVSARQNYATIIVDQLTTAYKKFTIAHARQEAALKAHRDQDAAEQQDLARSAWDEFEKRGHEFHDFYNEQGAALMAIKSQTKVPENRELLDSEIDRLLQVDQKFSALLAKIPGDERSCKALLASSEGGFVESSWLTPAASPFDTHPKFKNSDADGFMKDPRAGKDYIPAADPEGWAKSRQPVPSLDPEGYSNSSQ